MTARKVRVRRSVEDARRAILDAAERRLIEGGPDAIRVQIIARDLGITDAAIHYHFSSRDGLMEALLRRAGRRLKESLVSAVGAWDPGTLDLHGLIGLLDETYDRRGIARLATWMKLSGWNPGGAGMFLPLAQEVDAARGEEPTAGRMPSRDTLFVVELLTLVVWAEAVAGDAWRRSVGLPADRKTRQEFLRWFGELLTAHLARPPP